MEKINFEETAEEASAKQENLVVESETASPEPIEEGKRKKKNKLVLFVLGLIVLLGLLLVLNTLALIRAAQNTVGLAQEAVAGAKAQDLPLLVEKLRKSQAQLITLEKIYQRFIPLKLVPFVSGYYQDGQRVITAGKAGLEAGIILTGAIEPYADVLGFKGKGSFTGGTAEDRIAKIIETMDKVTPKIDEVAAKLKVVEEELILIDENRYPQEIKGKKVREQLVKVKKLGQEASQTVEQAKPMIKVLPQILGDKEPQKYLVLFQNDGELRPTGGFMTAYAILKVEKGKVGAEKSDDIYSLDKKFGKRLEAPRPIKEYLPLVDYWHLRDMNLSPDFRVSMETFYPYYKELPDEEEVDGIVAIDTKVLKDLLDILGPVNVPGYGEFKTEIDPRCNVSQVICELEHIVDRPLATVVTTRKISILGPMMQEILFKAMAAPNNLWPQLARLLVNELKEKHVLLYFTDQETQLAAEKFGAAGRISDYQGDYLLVNDTNFGGAKSNLYLHYQVEQEIKVEENGDLIKTLTLTYTNPEPMDDCNLETQTLCLNGILPNWLRVYVPKGSELIEALGSEVKVQTYEELDKTVFEAFFEIRGDGGKAKVVFNFRLPFKAEDSYRLLIQKQPGKVLVKHKLLFGDHLEEFDLVADKEIEIE